MYGSIRRGCRGTGNLREAIGEGATRDMGVVRPAVMAASSSACERPAV